MNSAVGELTLEYFRNLLMEQAQIEQAPMEVTMANAMVNCYPEARGLSPPDGITSTCPMNWKPLRFPCNLNSTFEK